MAATKTLIVKCLSSIAVSLAIFIFSIFYLPLTVLAGSGLVSQVGGATFIQGAKQFWVTSSTPTFSGITSAGAKVSGTVGSQTVTATADSSGNWSWTPATALSGDTAVSITSGTTTAGFTLTIGSVPASIASASAGTLAPAGSVNPTILFLAGGSCLILLGSFGLRKSFR